MKIVTVLLTINACLFLTAGAQVRWGANAGLNISNISNSRDNNAKPLLTFQISGMAMIAIGESLVMQPSLGYRGKGYKLKSGSSRDSLGGQIKALHNYLQLSAPVALRCNANENYKIYAGGGPYLAYFINGKWNDSSVRTENFHRVDLGLDLSLLLIIHRRLTIAVASDLGLISVNKFTNSTNINSGITLGYLIN